MITIRSYTIALVLFYLAPKDFLDKLRFDFRQVADNGIGVLVRHIANAEGKIARRLRTALRCRTRFGEYTFNTAHGVYLLFNKEKQAPKRQMAYRYMCDNAETLDQVMTVFRFAKSRCQDKENQEFDLTREQYVTLLRKIYLRLGDKFANDTERNFFLSRAKNFPELKDEYQGVKKEHDLLIAQSKTLDQHLADSYMNTRSEN